MDGHQYHLTGGEAFLIPSSVEAWYEADMDNPWTYRWVGFEGMIAEEVIHVSGFSREIRSEGSTAWKMLQNILMQWSRPTSSFLKMS